MTQIDQLTLDGRNPAKEARDLKKKKAESMESKRCFGKAGTPFWRLNSECRSCVINEECGFPTSLINPIPLGMEPDRLQAINIFQPILAFGAQHLLGTQKQTRCLLIR